MNEETQLLERIDDVRSFLQKRGKYHTSTGHQAYAVLKTLGWHPWVKMGEELYFPEGSVIFAEVDPIRSVTPNVEKIGWGTTDDYYERRLRDYDNWEVAFWREIVQNSRDSGASNIDIECVEGIYEDPETKERVECMRVSAADDGRGMDYDTMMTAFFRRGGTLKETGSVGGFGDAKNLILTPWLGYEVRSHDVVARGRHEDLFADLTKQGQPFHQGTKVTVWMPLAKTTTPEHAQFLVEQSSLDHIRFKVNGKRVKGGLPKGKLVQEKKIIVNGVSVGDLMIHHSPRARRSGVYVRSHGLYMYEMHGWESEFKGVVTIDVNAPPIDVFTTKRDALSYQSSARADVNDVLRRLASDPKQALKAVRDKKQIVFRGTGAIEAMEGRVAEMAAEIASRVELAREKRTKSGAIKLGSESVEVLVRAFTQKADELSRETETDVADLDPLPSTFGTLVAQTEFINTDQVAGAIQLSMWKPDFFLFQNISPWNLPKALHPETMQNKYHVLLSVWTEVCKFLLVQFGMFEPFGVGWVFDSEYDYESGGESVIAAAYQQHEGQHWLLLNPVEIERLGYGDNVSFQTAGDRFKLSNPDDIERLVTYAVHEITHMQGISSHTDAYASAITANMQAVFRIAPVLKKIVKEARAAVRKARKAAKEAAPDFEWEVRFESQEDLRRKGDGAYVGYITQAYGQKDWEGMLLEVPVTQPTTSLLDMDAVYVDASRSKRRAKEAVERAAAKAFGSATSRSKKKSAYGSWEEAGPDNWLLKRSDGKYVAQAIRHYGTEYTLYLPHQPQRDYDFDGRWWGEETNLPGAKRLLEIAARKMFPLRESSEERLIWDPYEAATFTYGTRARDNRTVVSVRINNDDMFVPRVWVESTQEWTEGQPLRSFEEAKEAAEELYAQLA